QQDGAAGRAVALPQGLLRAARVVVEEEQRAADRCEGLGAVGGREQDGRVSVAGLHVRQHGVRVVGGEEQVGSGGFEVPCVGGGRHQAGAVHGAVTLRQVLDVVRVFRGEEQLAADGREELRIADAQ